MKKRRRGDRKVHFQCRVSGKSFGLSAADCSLLETVEEIRIEPSPGESKLDEWIRCLARWIIIEPVMLRGLGASLFSMRFFSHRLSSNLALGISRADVKIKFTKERTIVR